MPVLNDAQAIENYRLKRNGSKRTFSKKMEVEIIAWYLAYNKVIRMHRIYDAPHQQHSMITIAYEMIPSTSCHR